MRRAAQQYGLREAGDNDDWTLYWTDYSVSLERVMEMKSYQVCPPTLDVWHLASGGPVCSAGSQKGSHGPPVALLQFCQNRL